jgi:hypothetical protein
LEKHDEDKNMMIRKNMLVLFYALIVTGIFIGIIDAQLDDNESLKPDLGSLFPSGICHSKLPQNEHEEILSPYQGADVPQSNYPAIWFDTHSSWSKTANCQQGNYIKILINVPLRGSLLFVEIHPDFTTKLYKLECKNPGYNYLWYYAGDSGRHIVLFIINDASSNAAIIEVKGDS